MPNVPEEIARLSRELAKMRRGQRYAHGGSIENAAIEVRDDAGSLRGIVGQQGDGTTAVNIVNGPPPPAPSDPIVASVLGGITVSWDGLFAAGAVIPLDWQRVEVHASIVAGFTPSAATLATTIETAQGSTVVVSVDTTVYVRLVARNTSGTASTPSTQVGPYGPAPVVADEILDGIVTATKIANGAVLLNTLGGPLADLATQRYADYMTDGGAWGQLSASAGATWVVDPNATGTPSGGGKMTVTGAVQLAGTTFIPQDTDTLYRVMVRVRATAEDPSGPATVYLGLVGMADDKTTFVNRSGANSTSSHFYCASNGGTLTVADGWKTYIGYIQGHSASGVTAPAGPNTDPRVPGTSHFDVRYLRPTMWLNFGKNNAAVMEVEAFTVEALRTGTVGATNLITGSVTAAAIATDAVTAGKVAADAITARELTAGSVTTAKLDALAVTSDKVAANAIIAGKIAAGAVSANSLTVGVGQSISAKITDAMGDATLWAQTFDSGTSSWLTGVTDAAAGGTLAQASGPVTLERVTNTPYDPDTLYKVTVRVRTTVAPTAGTATVYMGLVGVAADGTTRVSSTGANNFVTGQHFITANNVTIAVGTTWTTLTGYVQGNAATGTTTACPDPKAPGKLHTNARYVRPIVRLLMGATGGTMQVDQVTLETVPTGVVNAVNIANGAVTASTLAADAITGKTITGGVLQTATTGQRVTINEAAGNKILVYDSTGRAVAELSGDGMALEGTNGAQLIMDPDSAFPNFRLTNNNQSAEAVINVSENTAGAADLGLNSGQFASHGFTDMKWRTFFGNDFWVAEKIRDSDYNTYIGGRVYLADTYAKIGYVNTALTPDLVATLSLDSNQQAVFDQTRLIIQPPVSSSSVIYVEAPTGYTGTLLRLRQNGLDKFYVDKDGNTYIDGVLTGKAMATGSVSITPVANTPTSVTVSGLNLSGTVHRAFVTAQSAAPGTVVECSATSVTNTGLTIWVNRTNTTNTNIWYLVIAS
ncbi:hypothetical protein [Streptomyces sp. NPDC046862]|uniref:hypothetical protein n=1 Tax=Streptomyces sp. NPDC046862 TaxID=3154603 RepID=UPI003451F26F